MSTLSQPGVGGMDPAAERRSQQRAWSWYDWANSAFFTTVTTTLFAPWFISIAEAAAPRCSEAGCVPTLDVLGVPLAAGSLPGYLVGFSTALSALLLPVVGALIDRSPRKKRHLAAYAWTGSLATAVLFLVTPAVWWLGAVAIVTANVLIGCSLVCYNAILVDISTSAERDDASSRGWAWGYLGGGVLLVLNLAVVQGAGVLGISTDLAVRLSLLSAALWWAGFTIIPVVRLRDHEPRGAVDVQGSLLRRSFGQLAATLAEVRRYPMTMTFLLAYLFYNDGIQTVITSASTYGAEQLGLAQSVLIATILLIQFVAFGGALLFGRLAGRFGAYRLILGGTVGWMAIVVGAFFLPVGNVGLFLLLGVAVAVVMGGTQALSRSFFSLLIPAGREGAYFSLYQAAERGTSWFGAVLFSLTFQLTGSYRPSILVLVVFFALGGLLLVRLDPERGIREAGNAPPAVV